MDNINLTNLIILVVVIVIAWFLVRRVIDAITCGVRILLTIIVAIVGLYIIGSLMEWPIIETVNQLLGT